MANLNLDTASREELIEGLVFLMNAKSEDFDKLSKNKLEFSRYKQDCRKRALECAMDECRRVGGFAPIIKDPSKLVHQEEAKPFDILAEADKYYQWLITIPQ